MLCNIELFGSGVPVFTALSGVRIADELPCEDIETADVVDDGVVVVGVTVVCSPFEALSLFLPVTGNIIKKKHHLKWASKPSGTKPHRQSSPHTSSLTNCI